MRVLKQVSATKPNTLTSFYNINRTTEWLRLISQGWISSHQDSLRRHMAVGGRKIT